MTFTIIALGFLIIMILIFAGLIWSSHRYYKKHPQDEYRINNPLPPSDNRVPREMLDLEEGKMN